MSMDCCFAMEALGILPRWHHGLDYSVFAPGIHMMSAQRSEELFA